MGVGSGGQGAVAPLDFHTRYFSIFFAIFSLFCYFLVFFPYSAIFRSFLLFFFSLLLLFFGLLFRWPPPENFSADALAKSGYFLLKQDQEQEWFYITVFFEILLCICSLRDL